ncbi:MAG: AMP-binding protein [Chromatiaceae bacterium]|nr:AMP-binding protein [Chromatiaceae bacterium]
MNLVALIEDQASRNGARPCIYFDTTTWTWCDLQRCLCAAAARLRSWGVIPGSVVAQAITEEPLQLVFMLATARLGATVFTLPRKTPPARARRLLQDVGASLLVTNSRETQGINLSSLRVAHAPGIDERVTEVQVPMVEVPKAPWIIAVGSGSTGAPKYLPISHAQQLARMELGLDWLPYQEQDKLLSLVRLDFYASKLRYLEAFARGAAIYMPNHATFDLFDDAAAGHFTVLYGTVFHIEQILKTVPRNAAARLSALRAIMVGGSAVSTNLRVRIRDRLSPRLYVLYGANECSTSCRTRLDEVYQLPGGVGHPHPGLELQVVDDDDQPLPVGAVGAIRLRGPTCIQGYLNDPKATARVFRGGWIYPGDLGRLTDNGQLIHLGRTDDLMIMNGINIYPAEIEETLLRHPAVRDVVAMPLIHPVHQDIPMAVVSLQAGAQTQGHELLRFVQTQIGRFALHRVVVIDEVPRNEQGKLLRDEIRRQVEESIRSAESMPFTRAMPETPDLTAAQLKHPPADASNDHDGRSLQPRQLVNISSATFQLPHQEGPAALELWLQVLEDDLPVLSAPPASDQAQKAVLARHWLARCLRLARLLLQALRVPIFDEPRILDCKSVSPDGLRWRARFELALVDHAPRVLFETSLRNAFSLANWAASHPPTAANRETFFAAIRQRVLRPCTKFVPPGTSTIQVLRVAHRQGIPFHSLGSGAYQLGWGSRAKRIDRSSTCRDTPMGMRLTSNKLSTARLLRMAGLPGPEHAAVNSVTAARQAAQRLGWPVVVKPADRERGEGVNVDVDAHGLQAAFEEAMRRSRSKQVLIERQVEGTCHRLFVAGGRLLYAVNRLPMGVYGDGTYCVAELVAHAVAEQRLKPIWKRIPIRPLDDLARTAIANAGLTEQSVPMVGQFVPLRRIESTKWGGVDEDVTEVVHPENLRIAIAAAGLFGLDVAGIDLMTPDISQPWHDNGAMINEVNYAPLLGGGDISRRCIPDYLDRLLGGNGRIPVEVFVGGAAAWQAALARHQDLRGQNPGVCITSAADTRAGDGSRIPMSIKGLYRRARALVLYSWVDVLILVVQTDELLRTGLPLDWVDRIVQVDTSLVSYQNPKAPLTEQEALSVGDQLSRWQSSCAPIRSGSETHR